jgi:hypothetical protein
MPVGRGGGAEGQVGVLMMVAWLFVTAVIAWASIRTKKSPD